MDYLTIPDQVALIIMACRISKKYGHAHDIPAESVNVINLQPDHDEHSRPQHTLSRRQSHCIEL